MKIASLTLAALAMATTALATPAFAQDGSGESQTRKVLGRLLDAVLGPEEEAAQETAAEETTAEAVTETVKVMTPREALIAAVDSNIRDGDRARDQYRHPVRTLEFFGVTPDMSVGEYAPGGGWYTRILAPYVAENGRYISLFFNLDQVPFNDDTKANIAAASENHPGRIAEWTGLPADRFSSKLMNNVTEEDHGTLDRVVIFRSLHGLSNWNMMDSEIKTMRALLKDDGMLGIVQHRAAAGADHTYSTGPRGYMSQDAVIALIEFYGFELVGSSEINANPRDPANHEPGVWHLPPTLAGLDEADDAERARRMAIGESDRMTLLFRKKT